MAKAKKTKRKLGIVTAPVQQTPSNLLRNHFAIVLDRSSSMSPLQYDVIKAVNAIIDSIKAAASQFGQETTISLYTFGSDVKREFFRQPAKKLQHLTEAQYVPYGNTALFDAVGMAIDDFEKGADSRDPDTSFVIITTTDGEENNSARYREGGSAGYYRNNLPSIVERMAEVQKTDRYTITFQLPPNAGKRFANQFSIPLGNVREWEATSKGVQEVSYSTMAAVNSYYTARSTGQKSVDTFYVQTDLSKVKKSDLKKLSDLSARFKSWNVDKEQEIRPFVESHGKTYLTGCAYYQLTKTEKKVQPGKQVLVMEKGTKAIYGGSEARDLIGLPHGIDAKVEPGNHANYDIFIQSTSHNRKLVRGTKVLFDTTLSVGLPHTWADDDVNQTSV